MTIERCRRLSIFLVGLMLAVVVGAAAQVNTAEVVGTVTDPSDSVIANARVTITNTATGVSRSMQTGAGGDYAFTALQVGTYRVRVESPGFALFEAQDLKLAAGDRVRLEAKLAVGKQEEVVQVSASTVALQTDSSVVGTLIADRAVENLPLNGRNIINLVQLSAGVSEGLSNSLSSGNRPDDRRQSSSYSANGQTDIVNNNLIDGMDNNERYIGTIGIRPSIDAIQEVKVQTNIFTAEVGRTAGAVVDVITKSGTNSFHGSAFEFLRNDVFDAKDAFAKDKAKLRQNQFGGSLGGPIAKGKTFFFGDYEGFRQRRGLTGTTTVPTLYEQQHPGDFSDIGGPVIPSSMFDPVGLAYFQMYPKPTVSDDQCLVTDQHGNKSCSSNYTGSPVRTQDSDTFDVRIDQHFSGQHSLFARYSYNNVKTFTPPILPQTTIGLPGGPLTLYPGDGYSGGQTSFAGQADETQQNIALNYLWVIRPQLLLELKAGFLRSNIASYPLNYGKDVATQIGFPCNSKNCINSPGSSDTMGLPMIFIIGSPYQSLGDAIFLPETTIDNTFIYSGSLNWMHGAHSIKFGAGLIRRQINAAQSSYPRGFYFDAGVTGNPMTDLLTGVMLNVQRGNTLVSPNYRTWEPSWYVQDDWRAARWLTLNLGLRYDIFTPYTEKHGYISNFDPAQNLLISPSLPGSQKSGATAGVKTDYSNVAPRIGFSAAILPQTVLRGGFGITYWPGNYSSGALLKNAPFTFLYGCGAVSGFSASCSGLPTLSSGLPAPAFDVTQATDPANYAGMTINATNVNYRASYLEQFSLQLQQEFKSNIVTVGYVGNLGRRLTVGPNINTPACGNLALCPYPISGLAAQPVTINERETEAISRYHAMQLTFQRKFKGGLGATANYTWAHMITNAPVIDVSQGSATSNCVGPCWVDDPANPGNHRIVNGWQQYDLGNGDLDNRHRVAVMINYQLPFGKSLHGAVAQLVQGWSTNFIYSYASGFPVTVLNSSSVSGIFGLSQDRPNMVGDPNRSGPVAANSGCSAPSAIHKLQSWFNPCAFMPQQTAGVLGNEARNQIYGPSRWHLDFSAGKDFPIHGDLKLQFRAELFNVTNTPSFNQPDTNLQSPTVGQITQTLTGSTPREIQFALKLLF